MLTGIRRVGRLMFGTVRLKFLDRDGKTKEVVCEEGIRNS
jgi:hypothetical protein